MGLVILITGAQGFVGLHLRAAFAARDRDDVVVPVDSRDGPGVRRVDLRVPHAVEALVAETRPDVLIHLAAQSSVARFDRDGDSAETFAVNVGGSLNLAIAVARHVPGATLLFASSAQVYGASLRTGVVTESSPLAPTNRYARSKKLAEDMFDAVLPAKTRLVVARPFNHTGPGQSEDFVLPSFVGQVARIEAGVQAPQLLVGNLEVRRDFIDVRDVVAAYIALVETPDLPARLSCNVGSGQAARPLGEIIQALKALSTKPFDVVVDPQRLRSTDVPVAEGDTRLLRDLTGWVPRIAFEDTLGDMLTAARLALPRGLEDRDALSGVDASA